VTAPAWWNAAAHREFQAESAEQAEDENVVLAWIACAIGIGAGITGCVLLASNPRRAAAARPATAARPAVYEPEVWAGLVGAAANDALGTLRRLASRAQPADPALLAAELRAEAARFRALRAGQPARAGDAPEIGRLLEIAATGADVEAARLAGGTVVRNDRRAFLDAVRQLCDVPRPDDLVAMRSARTASGDLAPSFTVA
jgi:hypothetical protein